MNRSRKKKIGIAAAGLMGVAFLAAFALPSWVAGAAETKPEVATHAAAAGKAAEAPAQARATLRVMTLNLAHGRGVGRHQLLTRKKTHEAKLDAVAEVLAREKPDLVALQEADGPSAWSGNFNHVQYVAEKAGFACSVRGEHVKALRLSYGTALLSQLPLGEPLSFTFEPTPPTPPKGFVLATVAWPGKPEVKVDVVSVHLDFARRSAREKQAEQMIARLAGRGRPLIVMGDFNGQWTGNEPTLRTVAEKLRLRAHRPEAEDLVTFPKLKRRLDWILVSPELEFSTHEVLEDKVSDHHPVLCELRLAEKADR